LEVTLQITGQTIGQTVSKTAGQTTGAFALIDSIIRQNVKHLFGYPGGAILPVYDEIYQAEERGDLVHILVRHEQAAAHAADGYARATGKVGVCIATSGPGATNLVTGIATAQMDSIPLIVITGQVPSKVIGTDAFQETDIWGITLPIVKHSYAIRHPEEIARIVAEAFHIASTGRPGPVLIDIPKDIAQQLFDYEPSSRVEIKGYNSNIEADLHQVSAAIKLIRAAKRPLLYVGGGAIIADAHPEIAQLAHRFQIPVTTTLMGKGAFDENDNLSVGMLGMHGSAYANFAVQGCDLLIAAGARFDDRVTGKLDTFAPEAQVIHIDIDPAEVGKNRKPEVAIAGDVKQVLASILSATSYEEEILTKDWLKQIQQWKKEQPLEAPHYRNQLAPQEVIAEFGKQAPHAFYTTDVGQHQMWAAQFLKNGPRQWISSAGLGTMGYGMPAALGVKVALPEAQVICISGDASFQMNLQELATLAQYGINIKIAIINNGWQGMVRQWQKKYYGGRYASSDMEVGMPDFVKLAEAFGIKGMLVTFEDDLEAAVAQILAYEGPILVDFRVKRDENCYPMVPPGASNSEMEGLREVNRELVAG
jgi:acetolactate synthase I/II/III large subunit